MGTPKAALEWHGSTLLRRITGLVGRAVDGPVVVVRAPGQELPALPEDVELVQDAREGRGPLQGLAAGLDAARGRARIAYVTSTDVPFLHPAFVRRVLAGLGDDVDVVLPHLDGYPQPLAAAYRVELADVVERLIAEDRMRPAFLFDACRVRRIEAPRAAPRPGARGAGPRAGLGAEPQRARRLRAGPRAGRAGDHRAALRRPAPPGDGPRSRARARRHAGRGGRRDGPAARRARRGGAERRPDHPRRRDAARRGGHGGVPLRGRRAAERGVR